MSDFKSIADVPEMLELWDFDKNPEDPYFPEVLSCHPESLSGRQAVPPPSPARSG